MYTLEIRPVPGGRHTVFHDWVAPFFMIGAGIALIGVITRGLFLTQIWTDHL